MLAMILCLHVASSGAIFRLNTCAGSIHGQSFAACDIGNAQLQGCHHADLEHLAPVREKHLSATSDDHDVTSVYRSCDDVAYGILVG
jgi:hypothetical protein